ncbi:hypothetical protein ACQZV8_00010 [Magnetococcales bacterium HHB-1]
MSYILKALKDSETDSNHQKKSSAEALIRSDPPPQHQAIQRSNRLAWTLTTILALVLTSVVTYLVIKTPTESLTATPVSPVPSRQLATNSSLTPQRSHPTATVTHQASSVLSSTQNPSPTPSITPTSPQPHTTSPPPQTLSIVKKQQEKAQKTPQPAPQPVTTPPAPQPVATPPAPQPIAIQQTASHLPVTQSTTQAAPVTIQQTPPPPAKKVPTQKKQPKPYPKTFTAKISGVISACELEIKQGEKRTAVTLANIACRPEITPRAIKRASKKRVARLVFGKKVSITRYRPSRRKNPVDIRTKDAILINRLLIEEGLAYATNRRFQKQEQQAKSERRGVWANL